ncbi:hypothetical protein [Bacillus sp. AFS088145]|uniref:hypothetical protein n=1 Tax=Bacillus sp. AFS088145 TaxID=2033514 RepID=UPI000BF35759|nr:hypothetical protein [Bacillus sp. AFS088145]PFH83609.1 hypothetical protein COI44_17535 [Bacillus sp. AFS088145]
MDQHQRKVDNIKLKLEYYERLLQDRIEYSNQYSFVNEDVNTLRTLIRMYQSMLKELKRDNSIC